MDSFAKCYVTLYQILLCNVMLCFCMLFCTYVMLATCHYILADKIKASDILKCHATIISKLCFPVFRIIVGCFQTHHRVSFDEKYISLWCY